MRPKRERSGAHPEGTRDTGNFDRVAAIYRVLERMAFGRVLERARFRHLDALAACRNILVVGDGDGRAVERLAGIATSARIHCIDTSGEMLRLLQRRLNTDARQRVTWQLADVRTVALAPQAFDAVVTLFVLDCLSTDDAARVVDRISRCLRPAAYWAFADFSIPDRGWRRWRARLWVRALYAFFGWRTGLDVRQLPPSEQLIRGAGFETIASDTFDHGLVRCVLFRSCAQNP